ncbi:hypothetical protein Syun_000759 [Stephania yunnanensis]|uniref:Uncharacterized protein n=1 Tax=Stephania yunnanensis TaxID=152371 RepID=A0AAP0LI44_9MAGN
MDVGVMQKLAKYNHLKCMCWSSISYFLTILKPNTNQHLNSTTTNNCQVERL